MLDRPEREPCDPADFGLDPSTIIARACGLDRLDFERRDLAGQTRFLGDFGLKELGQRDGRREFAARESGPAIIEIEQSKTDRLASITFALEDCEFDKAHKAALSLGFGAGENLLRIPAPGEIDLHLRRVARQPKDADTAVAEAPTSPTLNRESSGWIAPSRVLKLGHVVLQARDPIAAVLFYRKWLGLIPSDIQILPSGRPVVIFMRLDKGGEPADHHTLVVAQSYKDGFDHAAFETRSIDDVGFGHQHLKAKGWRHSWGLGRHWLGGQFFDYWRDPAGAHFEHYAGSDTYTADHPPQLTQFSRGTLYSWGADLPGEFTGGPRLGEIPGMLKALWRGELDSKVLKEMQAAAKPPPRPWMK